MRFIQFRLRTRLLLGSAVLVLLLLGIAGFGSYGLTTASREMAEMDAYASAQRRGQEILFRTEVIRRALTRYRLDANVDAQRDAVDAEARAGVLLADAIKQATSPQRLAEYQSAAEALHTITGQVETFVSRFSQAFADIQKLTTTGEALRSGMAKVTESVTADDAMAERDAIAAAQIAVLTVRMANLRFQASPSSELIDAFAKAAPIAQQTLAALETVASPGMKPMLAPVVALLGDYIAVFQKSSVLLVQATELYNTQIRVGIVALQSKIAKVQESLSAALDEANQQAQSVTSVTLTEQLGLSGAGTVVGIVLALLTARSIIGPVNGMIAAMSKLVAGDTGSEIPGRGNSDEIGEMARAVEVFRQHAIQKLALESEQARQHAAKERRQKAVDAHIQDFGTSVSGVMGGFMVAANAMRKAAAEVMDGAQQTRTSTSNTAEGAMASSRDLNSVAAATEETAVSINEISKQVTRVGTSVQAAVERATETDAKVGSLSEAADRIGDVVRIITDIAGQTNLLALNATIEAARAGEAGKGFAVVAGEVKALATQTARATDQIGTQIVAIRGATGAAVTAVRDVVTAIGEVESVAAAIAASVEEQAAATREITNSVQQVTVTTAAAAQSMRDILSIVESSDASSQTALTASEELGRTAETLSTEVADFLKAISTGSDAERRLYERIPGGSATATMRIAGAPAVSATIQDISRGGIALLHACKARIGTDAEIVFPDGSSINGRVARVSEGAVAFAFRQDSASLAKIERALDTVRRQAGQRAA